MTRDPLADDGRVSAVLLAAGRGSRFGGSKMLADLDGAPLLGHAIAAATSADLDVLAVVPPDHRVLAVAETAGARVVVQPDPDAGLSASLVAGLTALPLEVAAAVVLLGDQPTVDPDAIRAVVAAWRERPATPWRVRYSDGFGHPVLLPRSVWGLLRTVHGDRGAGDLLADLGTREVVVSASIPVDVDLPTDLESLRTRGAGRGPGS